ncbi:uncharacterized protein ACRADG_009979 isoform 1-T14 [Cochliomyia hominivorax]
MDSMVFKFKHHHHHQQHQPHQQQHQQHFTSSNSNYPNYNVSSNNHNNNNQNSIFILNTATNNILPNNPNLYYADLNDNNHVPLSTPSTSAYSTATATSVSSSSSTSSSVWSSASSTMCSPAAHAIQKLFNCSSNSLKLNNGNHSRIDAKPFKSKSDLLKKKTKFWKYLEGEANDKNNQRGIEEVIEGNYKKLEEKSLKIKSKYFSKSNDESDNQNTSDLSELLEYSCSLCDNCRCMDCQIGYFDCENSDDSNSEYSFHLSAYEEEELNVATAHQENSESDNGPEVMELKTDCESEASPDMCCNELDNKSQFDDKSFIDSKLSTNCSVEYCNCRDVNCDKVQCCQQCWLESMANDQTNILATQRDH